MMDEAELGAKITELEVKKTDLINRIKKVNARKRYKQYEEKALEPFLEKTRDVDVGPLRRQRRAIEFRIATQAYTPKMEKELLKAAKKLDDQLAQFQEVERARRKKRYVIGDLAECEKEITEIETQLHVIRDELKKLYDEARTYKSASKKGIKFGPAPDDGLVTLEEMGVIIEQG
ncbi:MAG: hypothetical protein AABW86_03245 [Candidatus Micrarchaeota archaeon]